MTDQLPPIRCVTCGKVLADKWNRYEQMIESGVKIEDALNQLGLNRPCCRLRLRNPFKVVPRSGTQFDHLSVSIDSQVPTTGALEAMNSSSFTVIPEEEEESDIVLPSMPSIPKLPEVGERKVTRIYRAL
tara:strand:+ start:626 stop:1015 length:390 start_codon:yes stop_codon:yes gene_type:complete